MDRTAFQIVRDTLSPHVGPGAAHRKAAELVPLISRALKAGRPAKRELTGASRKVLSEGVQRAFQGVADEIRYYYAAEPFGYDHWDRGIATPEVWDALPTHIQMLELLVTELLLVIGRENSTAAAACLVGAQHGIGAEEGYPLCLQAAGGEPASLYFPGVIRRITRAAPSLAPDLWNDKSVAVIEDPLQLVVDVFNQKLKPSSDAEWFAWLYQSAMILVDILGGLSAMQWTIGEVAAGYHGIDRFETDALKDQFVRDVTIGRGTQRPAFGKLCWKLTVAEETDPHGEFDIASGVRIVAKALRHAMLDEPFDVPVVSTRIQEDPNGQLNRMTVTVNHPFVGIADAASALRQGLLDMRKLNFSREFLLANDEILFVDAVYSIRGAYGLSRDDRAPHGFWATFTESWNRDHPEDPLTVNAARVRFHRLENRSTS